MTKPLINPKEIRLFIDERMKMKKPAERTIEVRRIAHPAEISIFPKDK